MKQFSKVFALCLVFVMVSLGSTWGVQHTAYVNAATNEELKIGVALPTLQEERWQNDYRYFQQEVEKFKNVKLLIQIADNDADKQFSQIENLISQGIKALIVGAVDTFAIGPVIDRCHQEGILVIAYCRLIRNAHLDVLTLFDPYQVQDLSIKYALSLAPKGNYVLLNGDRTTLPEAIEYRKAWYDNLKPYIESGDIKVVLEQYNKNWAPEEGMANTENALTKVNNNVAAIICANDGIAGGAIQALAARGLAGKVVVTGNDADLNALKRIVKGTQASTIYQNTLNQVRVTLETTVKLLKGEKIKTNKTYNNGKMDVPAIQIPCELVTKSNIDKVIIDAGVRTREEIYGK